MTGIVSRPCKALIVDDVAANRWVLGRLLSQLGVQWTEVGGGIDALRLLRRCPFDVVFMDVEMPWLDGPATTRRLRYMERPSGRHLPVIAFTSLESKEVRQRCFDAGMDAFMTKPVSLPLLRGVIDQVTDNRSPRVPAEEERIREENGAVRGDSRRKAPRWAGGISGVRHPPMRRPERP